MEKEILYRFFGNLTSPRQEKEIMDWVEADTANREKFEEERAIYDILVVNAPVAAKKAVVLRKRKWRRVLGYAAAAVVMFGVIAGYGQFAKNGLRNEFSKQAVKLNVPAGQRINVTLSDGTNVWLNANTELEYPAVFDKERRVKIIGEAVFEVEHDAERPFIVETFACNLEVLGTKFSVLADREDSDFAVSLFEGSLKVSNISGRGDIMMKPNDKVVLNGDRMVHNTGAELNDILWTQGLISLEGRSFEELLDKFESYYDVTIKVERSSMPKLNIAWGKIKLADGLEHALRILQMSANFTYVRQDDNNLIIIR